MKSDRDRGPGDAAASAEESFLPFHERGQRCRCAGDAEKVEQILLNLLSNAIKFTDSGGAVTVSLECDATTVAVNVADSGAGISEDKLQAVFEPFVQLNQQLAELSSLERRLREWKVWEPMQCGGPIEASSSSAVMKTKPTRS